MRQRNNTGYPLLVQPPEDSHRQPFELAPGETVDYPTPIAGCGADDGVVIPDDAPPAKPAAKKTTAKTADGGDPA